MDSGSDAAQQQQAALTSLPEDVLQRICQYLYDVSLRIRRLLFRTV